MVELVEGIGQLIDISTNLVGCQLVEGILQRAVETGQSQLQRLLAIIFRCRNPSLRQIATLGLILVQDGLNPYDGVQDIRSGIALKGGKAVDIKDIILGRLVGQVAVLDGGQANLLRRIPRLFLGNLRILRNLLIHLLIDISNQVLQTHHAALAGLEGLAVLAVHGTKA